MAHTIRDDRIDSEELEGYLDDVRASIDQTRPRVRDRELELEAETLCRDNTTFFTLRYAAGEAVQELADTLDEWGGDLLASLQVRQKAAGGAAGFLARSEERSVLLSTINLVFVATSLGRADIATAVLSHPAVAAVPSRLFDALATAHGLARPVSESEVLVGAYDPWLAVASAPAERRQETFDAYVRGWRAHNENERFIDPVSEYFTGAWAFEAVILVQLWGLDDGLARDVPEYPVDLADFARDAGVPRLSAETTLPGPWDEPAPPKVIEPQTAREPVAGEPTLVTLSALLAPVGGERLEATDVDALLDAAVVVGTVVTVDARALDPADTAALLQLACRDLGLPAPGRGPSRLPKDPAKALPKFDAWLAKVGVRLLSPAMDADDLAFFPVLAEDYETFGGHTVAGLRLRTMEQVADDES